MDISFLLTKIKKNFRKRKGLISVLKTYKTHGLIESLIELFFLIMERLKINLGKFIISRQTIYLYSESKHLNWLEKRLVHQRYINPNNSRRKKKPYYLVFETI